jgi:heptosyltransferase-2
MMGNPPEKIIVRMPNWIGDLVMATPVLTDLRKAFPSAHITAMSRSPVCELLKEDPQINEVFCFHRTSQFSRRSERRDVVDKLRKGSYDFGLLLTHSLSSAWLFWEGRVKRRVGYRGGFLRSLLLTDPVPERPGEEHLVVTYKRLLETSLGLTPSSSLPRLFLTASEKTGAEQTMRQLGIPKGIQIVGINPGAAYGSAKCWLPERFQEVARRLLARDKTAVIFFGDAATTPLVKEICQSLPPQAVNLAGLTSIRELAALISQCTVLLTNDSGPMHIATAVGTPVVALFGSTNASITGPYGGGAVIHKPVPCSPCYRRTCPIDFPCMKQIEVDEVVQEIVNNLKS